MPESLPTEHRKILLAFPVNLSLRLFFLHDLEVPRKNPVPENERAICQRLMEARKSLHLSRAGLARILGVEPKRYANYEAGTVPVPYGIGSAACEKLGVNQRWLATGEKPSVPFVDVGEAGQGLDPKAAFSSVFEQFLRPHVDDWLAAFTNAFLCAPEEVSASNVAGMPPGIADSVTWTLESGILATVFYLPDTLKALYARKIMEASKAFTDEHQAEINRRWDEFDAEFERQSKAGLYDNEKKSLASFASSQHTTSVPHTLDKLLRWVRDDVNVFGNQTALAKSIGVHPSQLSRWLNGEGKPNAEATLRLLNWITPRREKLKKEKAAGASNTSGGKDPATKKTKP